MRLGIDFGTTRTVVAVADRGNYPIVSFHSDSGDSQPWHPSLVAARGNEVLYGLEAQWQAQGRGWSLLRSLKRRLAASAPDSHLLLGGASHRLTDLLTGYLRQLHADLAGRSNLEMTPGEPLEAMIAVPANANSNQRFVTLEAFRAAGFRVAGMINEPSAAGIEYAQRYGSRGRSTQREHLAVYDLGGGTFDVAVIGMRGHSFDVLHNEGIERLGGDDFDELLLELALAGAPELPPLDEEARAWLLEECREQKERLHPNTRKLVVDLGRTLDGAGEVMVSVDEFYARCQPLVERTVEVLEQVVSRCLDGSEVGWGEIAAVYLVGGSSDLPVVGRTLRQHYTNRVRRSLMPFASTAIGLAVALDRREEVHLRERFSRYFGVWRESHGGQEIVFDPIFPKGTPLPRAGDEPLVYTRTYHPAHTIGHYRFLECSHLGDDGQPQGDLTPWDEFRFPLDPSLQAADPLELDGMGRRDDLAGQKIQERYSCDHHGMIEVTVANQTAGYSRTYRLRR